MPYATARDSTRLYYEEAGTGSPILFLHEFAADYASWEPQMRYFSRARGYAPSEVPSAEAFTYEHFRDDALAVLDHLGIERAHLAGLSMGAYSSLQVGLHRPQRVLSLTLAGVGSGSEPAHIDAFRESAQKNARDFETLGSAEVAKTYGNSPNRIAFKVKDPRGFLEFMEAECSRSASIRRHASRREADKLQSIEYFPGRLQSNQGAHRADGWYSQTLSQRTDSRHEHCFKGSAGEHRSEMDETYHPFSEYFRLLYCRRERP